MDRHRPSPMRTTLYFIIVTGLLFVVPQVIVAQPDTLTHSKTAFSKGSKQVTASYGYGQGNLLQNRNVIGIQAGYYLANRLMVGVAGSLMREWIDNLNSGNKFSAGPVVRYQFTASRLSPFAQLSYQLGNPVLGLPNRQAVFVTPGVNLALLAQVRLEASYSLLFIPSSEWIGQPQIGATILLGTNR